MRAASILVTIATVLLPLVGDAAGADKKQDPDLTGTWSAVLEIPFGGRPTKPIAQTWVFGKDTITIQFKDQEEARVRFTLDTTRTPKWIDLTYKGDVTFKGVYEIREGRLWICTGSNDKRPDKITPDRDRLVKVLKRESGK